MEFYERATCFHSLNMVELMVELEDEFGIEFEESDLDPSCIQTVEQIYTLVTKYMENQNANPTEPAQYKCKNIVFQGCTWLGGTGYSAEPGNEVVVK